MLAFNNAYAYDNYHTNFQSVDNRSDKIQAMADDRIRLMAFSSVYPHYVAKAIRKGRSKEEVDQIIFWLTGYDLHALQNIVNNQTNFEDFFNDAPALNPRRTEITGVICGVRIENIQDPLMKEIRYLDKLIDELAKGRSMEKILRK